MVGWDGSAKRFLLAGYQQVGQFLYVVGGFDLSAINNATTWRLDMSSAPGAWRGPAFTPRRADFGLAYDAGTNKLYALGGDLPNDGGFFDSTNLVDELVWQAGLVEPGLPHHLTCHCPTARPTRPASTEPGKSGVWAA